MGKTAASKDAWKLARQRRRAAARRVRAGVRQESRGGSTSVDPAARGMLTGWLGRNPGDQQLRDMVGAPAGAHVQVSVGDDYTDEGKVAAVRFDVTGPPVAVSRLVSANPDTFDLDKAFETKEGTVTLPAFGAGERNPADRYLSRYPDGTLHMHNATFRVLPDVQGQNIGLWVFAKEAQALSALGVKEIHAAMAGWRGSSDQGYQVWPNMGYNTRPGDLADKGSFSPRDVIKAMAEMAKRPNLDAEVRASLQQTAATIKALGRKYTLLDLYQTKAGKAWWQANGHMISGHFDLTPGSRSMQKLQSYLREKGMDWNDLDASEPDWAHLKVKNPWPD